MLICITWVWEFSGVPGLGHDALTLRLRPNPWAENQHPTSAWHSQGKKGKEKTKKEIKQVNKTQDKL